MKKILLMLLSIPLVLSQASLFGMDSQRIIVIRITDIAGPKQLRYTLQVPWYRENRKTYVLFDDIYKAMNKQHNITNAELFNLLYFPDNKKEFIDYEKRKIFLNSSSLDDILVVKPEDNV